MGRTASTRTALVVALCLAAATTPAAQAAVAAPRPAAATTPCPAPRPGSSDAPDTGALRTALGGLPNEATTDALARVGGSGGTWRGSAGVHDLRTKAPADPDARFRAGSVTKVFTAAVVLQLASEGRVDLDARVRGYLPSLIPAGYGRVTVRELLNHTSGIPAADVPGTTVEEAYAHRFDRYTPQGMVAQATAKKPEFAPGTAQHYLNINYTVLGLLVEHVTGRPYASEVARRILDPLHLDGTYFPGTETGIHGPHNHGYQAFPAADGTTELRDATVWDQTEGYAAGDLISTTADLETFMDALFRGRVVPRPQLAEMFTLPPRSVLTYGSGAPAAYSAGLSEIDLGGRAVWGKSGSRYGYTTVIGATCDLSRTLVASVGATNAKGDDLNATEEALMVAAFGEPSA